MLEQEWKKIIEKDYEGHKASGQKVQEYLDHCSFCRAGEELPGLYIPKMFSKEQVRQFEGIVETTYRIFEKIIHRYIKDASYRKLFCFPAEIEELILIPNLYDCYLPVARFDIFYHEKTGDFQYCEINTDGTAAMNRQVELNLSLAKSDLGNIIKEKYDAEWIDPIESCMDGIFEIYATYEKQVASPVIAIADFLEDGSSYAEFLEFQKRFALRGYTAKVCDIRKLKYQDGQLLTEEGIKIDILYRRAVTTDIISHFKEVQAFIQAVREQAVCVIGSLCTQVVHNKVLFALIQAPETMEFLTEKEQEFVRAHFPYTKRLGKDDIAKYASEPEKWVLKPEDDYCSSGVYIGADYSVKEWIILLEKCAGEVYIVQEMCEYDRTVNIDFSEEDPQFSQYINTTGLYVFNGKLGGIFSRLAIGNGILSEVNERNVPTLVYQDAQTEG